MTSSSWMTSSDPETTKQRVSTLSPMWKMRSPGAQCVVWNSTARERRQPSLARRNAGWSLNTCLFRCTQISARMSLGQIARTWEKAEQLICHSGNMHDLVVTFEARYCSHQHVDLSASPYIFYDTVSSYLSSPLDLKHMGPLQTSTPSENSDNCITKVTCITIIIVKYWWYTVWSTVYYSMTVIEYQLLIIIVLIPYLCQCL